MAEDDDTPRATVYETTTPAPSNGFPTPGSVLQSWVGGAEKHAAAWEAKAGNRLAGEQVKLVQLAADFHNSVADLDKARARRGSIDTEIQNDVAGVEADLADKQTRIANANAQTNEVTAASAARTAQYEADTERALADKAKATEDRMRAEARLKNLGDPGAERAARITQLAEFMAKQNELETQLENFLMDDDEGAVLKVRQTETELTVISDMISKVRQKLLELDGL